MKNKAPNIRILTIRDQKVVLDVDLARVYGVTTKRLNEQFRRNRNRFPKDFAFQLTATEFESLRSQIATLNENNADVPKRGGRKLRADQSETSVSGRGYSLSTERCKQPTFCEATAQSR